MNGLNTGQARKLARENADAAAKLIRVLEAENSDLRDSLAAAHSFIFAMTSCYDYVDKGTGEIILAVGTYPPNYKGDYDGREQAV